jgi:hypothetical protein
LPSVRQARAGAGEGDAGLASFLAGPRKEAGGPRREEKIFLFIFQPSSPKNSFLSKKNSFLGHDPKTKVVHDFMLYNLAKRSKVKFQIDFEIEI